MKKTLCTLLALIITVGLAGCVSVSDDEIRLPVNGDALESTADASESEDKSATKDISISETVLLDEEGVKITAKSIDVKSFWGPEVKLLIENNSDKSLTIQARNTSVNGYMVETMMSVDVAAGKKATESLTIMSSSLEEIGVTEIADIETAFHIFDSNTWEDVFDSEQVAIKTSIADRFEYIYDMSGKVIYESEGITVVAKGLSDYDSIFGPGLILGIYNGTDKAITVQTRDVSVNGFMIDAIFSSDVASGKYAIDAATFFESDLEDNGIEKISDIELVLHIFEADTWETLVDTDVISLSFEE